MRSSSQSLLLRDQHRHQPVRPRREGVQLLRVLIPQRTHGRAASAKWASTWASSASVAAPHSQASIRLLPTNALKIVFQNELSLDNLLERLRNKRLRNLMTRSDLAKRLGTSSGVMASWESGATPKMESRDRIAEWLREPLPEWIETLNAGDISPRIREHRKAWGLTQDELARQLEVSVAIVRSWERGRGTPTIRNGRLLAEWLDEKPPVRRAKAFIDTELGERIRDKRRRQGMNRAELGKVFGVDRAQIRQWEKGIRTPSQYYTEIIDEWLGRPDDVLLSDRMREMRANLGMTQRDLASRLGCGLDAVRCWENNGNFPSAKNFDRVVLWLKAGKGILTRGNSKVDRTRQPEFTLFVQPIRRQRNRLGITTVELSSRLGVSQAMVSKWETCNRLPNLESCKKIFDWLLENEALGECCPAPLPLRFSA